MSKVTVVDHPLVRHKLTVMRDVSTSTKTFRHLMRDAGFRRSPGRALPEGAFGPSAPAQWSWRPPRKDRTPERHGRPEPAQNSAFAALAGLVR